MSEAPPIDCTTDLPAVLQVPRPSSMTKLEGLFDVACRPPDPFPLRISPASVSSMSSAIMHDSKSSSQTSRLAPHGHVPADTEKLIFLQTENMRLQEQIAYLKLEAHEREEELTKFKSDYYAERFKANVRKHLAKSADNTHEAQNFKLEQAERFILSMVEIGLHQPVLSEAWKAVAAGATADDALVESIKKAAAATPGGSWSKIVPAVVGPRTPDNYLASIDMTLKVAKELRKTKKITKFWKTKAKQDPGMKDLVTPSPSDLSDTSVSNDFVGYGERAVDALLKQLKSDGIHRNAKFIPPASVLGPIPTVTPRARPRVPVPTHHDFPAARGPPPAIRVFKDHVISSSSLKKQSKLSPTKKLRSVFGEIDINGEPRPCKQALNNTGTKLSAKLLGKRKAILVERVPPEPTLAVRSTEDASYKLFSKMDDVPFNLDYLPLPLSISGIPPSVGPGSLLAEKALESLERICVGFSCGSLGSLASTSEPSMTKDFGGVFDDDAAIVVDRTSAANDMYATCRKPSTQPQSPSFAATSIKTSTPVVSKFCQLRPLLQPSVLPSPQLQPPAFSSPKPTPSPTKNVLRKRTSPLRITKKAKVPKAAALVR